MQRVDRGALAGSWLIALTLVWALAFAHPSKGVEGQPTADPTGIPSGISGSRSLEASGTDLLLEAWAAPAESQTATPNCT